MANTPLLQRLADAFALARESNRTGISADELIDMQAQAISRRKFLGAAAVATVGGGLVASGLAACAPTDEIAGLRRPSYTKGTAPARVAIVGGGLAGLACAYQLKQQGVMATVYEGNTRLGGRCWSIKDVFANGQVAEHGGELIDQAHTQVRQLAQSLGLSLDNLLAAEPNGTDPLYWFDGAPYRYVDAVNDLKQIQNPMHRDLIDAGYPTLYNGYTARGYALDHMSVTDWINATVPGGITSRLGQLLEVAYVIEYGADAPDQSSLNLLYLLGYSGTGQLRVFGQSNEKYHVKGGNDQIVSRLAAQLSGQIVTDSVLTAIARTSSGAYTLTFGSGRSVRTVTADQVVLAIPFSVMRASVDYSKAGFNTVKKLAIAELGMGQNTKLNVQFSSRHWYTLGNQGDSYSDTGYQATWEVTRGQPGATGILVDYTGGSYAASLGGFTSTQLTQRFLRQLEPVMPGITPKWNGISTFDNWPGNPWTHGSYSYWKVGQYTRFSGAEREVSNDCHFAGEHTSQDSQGYLNGAVESGQRAANEVLAVLRA